jgi:CheY-like chemotaxis protein
MPEPTRILIVDDDPVLTKSLCDTLQSDDCVINAAAGGQAGIDAFQIALQNKQPFAVVITDLGMHGVDGRQVVGAIKKMSPSTPIILLTGWGQWFDNRGEAPLPVNCILTKPPKLAELRAALAQCLQAIKT